MALRELTQTYSNKAMKKETKELVELTTKWLEKISEITSNYATSIQNLESIRRKFDSRDQFWNRFEKLFPFILAFLAFITIYFWGCGTLKLGEFEYTKPCFPSSPS